VRGRRSDDHATAEHGSGGHRDQLVRAHDSSVRRQNVPVCPFPEDFQPDGPMSTPAPARQQHMPLNDCPPIEVSRRIPAPPATIVT
jgi:hypothetical protein